MNAIGSIRMALKSMKTNKMRSFLTMIGIIIGISSVIMIVSLGQGGQKKITDQFEKIGSSNVNISVDGKNAQATDNFILKDVEQIKQVGESIKYVTPSNSVRGEISSDRDANTAIISGGSPDRAYINNVEIVYGRYYNEREYEGGIPAALIDEDSAMALFGFKDAVGQSVTIESGGITAKVTLVGIIKSFNYSGERKAFVELPITYLMNVMGERARITGITVLANTKEELEAAGNRAVSILELRHGNIGEGIYRLESSTQIIDQINKVLRILTAVIGAIALISLVVGGVGIMNIMLGSVTERTREIGIRKSIGATNGNIMVQFLMEAAVISLIGGAIGVLLGVAGANAIAHLAGFSPSFSFSLVALTLLFSSAIGLFFGVYPAGRAAAMNPLEALRFE